MAAVASTSEHTLLCIRSVGISVFLHCKHSMRGRGCGRGPGVAMAG